MTKSNPTPDVTPPLLSEDEVLALNLRQAGIGQSDTSLRVICPNASDGRHEIIGGALGNMVAARACFACPFCEHQVAIADIAADSIRAALDAEPFCSPDGHTLLQAQDRIREYKVIGDRGGQYGAAYVLVTSLGRFETHASKLMKPKWGGEPIKSFPLALLLHLHNVAEPCSPVRKEIVDWLQGQRALNERQHWLDALTVTPTGELIIDNARLTYAAWRGKQETYFNAAAEQFEKMKRDLAFVARFQRSEDEAKATLQDKGEPLFRERQLLPEVGALKQQANRLTQMLEALGNGGLAQLVLDAPQLPQPPGQDE